MVQQFKSPGWQPRQYCDTRHASIYQWQRGPRLEVLGPSVYCGMKVNEEEAIAGGRMSTLLRESWGLLYAHSNLFQRLQGTGHLGRAGLCLARTLTDVCHQQVL